MSALQTLVEMGFPEASAKKAIEVTGGGVEAAMEFLLAHADDLTNPPQQQQQEERREAGGETGGNGGGSGGETSAEGAKEETMEEGAKEEKMEEGAKEEKMEEGAKEEEARSVKCDDCGKLFKTSEEVEFHAVKSGHSNFSESTEEKKPLTEDEKREKKKALEEKIKLRRKEREQEEEKEAREREKKRIQMGQEIAERKRVMQDLEMKRIAEERRREKYEDKLARERVREQIERDKEARKAMFGGKEGGKEGGKGVSPSSTSSASTPPPPPTAAAKKEYTTTRLQIRLPSGTPMVKEFNAREPLSAVRLWVGLNRCDGVGADQPVNLSMTFPRKIFTDEDMHTPLHALGLVPSAVLIVSK